MHTPQIARPRDVPHHNRLPPRRRRRCPLPVPVPQMVRRLHLPRPESCQIDHMPPYTTHRLRISCHILAEAPRILPSATSHRLPPVFPQDPC
jgi:hypothetical protein